MPIATSPIMILAGIYQSMLLLSGGKVSWDWGSGGELGCDEGGNDDVFSSSSGKLLEFVSASSGLSAGGSDGSSSLSGADSPIMVIVVPCNPLSSDSPPKSESLSLGKVVLKLSEMLPSGFIALNVMVATVKVSDGNG